MPLTWPQILVALEQIGASSPVVRPGLYGRVMERLRAGPNPPPPTAANIPPDDLAQDSSPDRRPPSDAAVADRS